MDRAVKNFVLVLSVAFSAIQGGGAMAVGVSASIDTVTSLRANSTPISAPYSFIVQGYSSIDDGGGGQFVYVPGDTTPDDGGTVIVDAANQHWHRIFSDGLNTLFWGALPAIPGKRNAADVSSAFISAVNAALGSGINRVTIAPGTYTWTTSRAFNLGGSGSPVGAGLTVIAWGSAITYTVSSGYMLTVNGAQGGGSGNQRLTWLGGVINGNNTASGAFLLKDLSDSVWDGVRASGWNYMPGAGPDGTQGTIWRLSNVSAWNENNRFLNFSSIGNATAMSLTNDGSSAPSHLRTIVQNCFLGDGGTQTKGVHFYLGDNTNVGDSRFSNLMGNFNNAALFSIGATQMQGSVIDGVLVEGNAFQSGSFNIGLIILRNYPATTGLGYERPKVMNVGIQSTASGGGNNVPIWVQPNGSALVGPEQYYYQSADLSSGGQIIGDMIWWDRQSNPNWLNGGNGSPTPTPPRKRGGMLSLTPGGTALNIPGTSGNLGMGAGTIIVFGGNQSAILKADIHRSAVGNPWTISTTYSSSDSSSRSLTLSQDGSNNLNISLSGTGSAVNYSYTWDGIFQ